MKCAMMVSERFLYTSSGIFALLDSLPTKLQETDADCQYTATLRQSKIYEVVSLSSWRSSSIFIVTSPRFPSVSTPNRPKE